MAKTSLSEKKMWDSMYNVQLDSMGWPYPEKECSAYELVEVFKRYLPKKDGTRIIEMGCGGSKWLPYFAKIFNYEIYGVDFSEPGCRMALENLKKIGKTGIIYCDDFLNLSTSFQCNFDVMTSYGVVEHFEEPEETLRKFVKCLSDNGLMVTYVPNFAGIMGKYLQRLNKPLYDTHKIFRLEDLVRYHQDAGMRIVFSSYLEFCDFTVLPIDGLSHPVMLMLKNFFHLANKTKLLFYKTFPLRLQNAYFSAAMLVVAQKE